MYYYELFCILDYCAQLLLLLLLLLILLLLLFIIIIDYYYYYYYYVFLDLCPQLAVLYLVQLNTFALK